MPRSTRPFPLLALAACLVASTATEAAAQFPTDEPMPDPTVRYTLSFDDAPRHLVDVSAQLPAPTDGADLELMMAVWTPGSYLVREFARHVERFEAHSGDRALDFEKVSKNRWRIDTSGLGPDDEIEIRYRVYCRELTVRTNFVDSSFAILNGAPTFLVPADTDGPAPASYQIQVELPDGWQRTVSPLPEVAPHTYRAADYDTLVDSPLYAGNGTVKRFDVAGVPHLLLDHPAQDEASPWDSDRAAADTEKIVRAQRELWGHLPYDRYVVFNLIVEAGGGLEHKDSTVLMTSRFRAATEESWRRWLGLVSHEVFHAWNVKRLRPGALGPFDYETENYTRELWFAEGVTSYYDDLLVHRANLSSRKDYLKELSGQVERLQTTPGRLVQTVEDASFDAWIKHYRRDEWTSSSAISYYNKGAMVAFVLDAEIRRATDGEKSFDDALRLAYERYAGQRGFERDEIRQVLSEVAGRDLGDLLARLLDSTEEIDFQPALDWYGLRFAPEKKDDDASDDDEPAGWLGWETRVDDGLLVVREVPRDTPAWAAGLQVDDEVLALDGFRVPPRDLDERLASVRPGDSATLLVARRGRITEVPVTFGEKPAERWKIEVDPDATPEQTAHLDAWLAAAGGD